MQQFPYDEVEVLVVGGGAAGHRLDSWGVGHHCARRRAPTGGRKAAGFRFGSSIDSASGV